MKKLLILICLSLVAFSINAQWAISKEDELINIKTLTNIYKGENFKLKISDEGRSLTIYTFDQLRRHNYESKVRTNIIIGEYDFQHNFIRKFNIKFKEASATGLFANYSYFSHTEDVEKIIRFLQNKTGYIRIVAETYYGSLLDATIPCINNSKIEIFKSVEQPPQFPGDDNALMKYIGRHIIYPDSCQQYNIQGKVVLQFVVETDGSIGEVKVVRSVDKDLDREAVRVCKSLPKFTPGRHNGQAVRVWYTVPVNFKLQGIETPICSCKR